MIQLYGVKMSRAFRSLWMLEELGLEYENVATSPGTGDTRKPDYLKINPNGLVPALVDGETVLWESMAINLYLARKYDGGFWPRSIEAEGHAFKWSLWAIANVEALLISVLMNRVFKPEDQRDAAEADAAEESLAKPFEVLDHELEGKRYLIEDRFTVADLNVASVLATARIASVDLAKFPNLSRWLDECSSRPAAQKARA